MIETPRLRLLPVTPAGFDALLPGDTTGLAAFLQTAVASDWLNFDEARDAIPYAAQYLNDHPDALGWWSYFFVYKPTNTLIGLGGYAGPPTPDGSVEIGYSIAPSYQGQGLATELILGLVDFAFTNSRITHVQAHTLPGPNASTRVLEKTGFIRQADIIDPDAGPIWAWISRP